MSVLLTLHLNPQFYSFWFQFVHPTMKRPSQSDSSSSTKIRPDSDDEDNTLQGPPSDRMSRKEDALAALKEDFDNLVPRWKGVVHTAEAERDLEARGKNAKSLGPILPWANIKFSQFIGDEGIKAKTVGSREYSKWEKIGFPAVGENMSLEELAEYKCKALIFGVLCLNL